MTPPENCAAKTDRPRKHTFAKQSPSWGYPFVWLQLKFQGRDPRKVLSVPAVKGFGCKRSCLATHKPLKLAAGKDSPLTDHVVEYVLISCLVTSDYGVWAEPL